MNLQEIKVDMMRRGIVFRDFISKQSIPGTIEVNLLKYDIDGLEVSANSPMDIEEYTDMARFEHNIRERMTSIENFITQRHGRNINNCQHQTVLLGSKIACMNCMGKFGDRIVLDIRGN